MSRKEFEKRQQRIAEGRCPRCDKPVNSWPLQRADVCHVAGATVCPRWWNDIHAAEARLLVRS